MRGEDHQQNHVFSYSSPELGVRPDHPLRTIRAMVHADDRVWDATVFTKNRDQLL